MNLINRQKQYGTDSGRPAWNDVVRFGNQRKQQARLKVKARRKRKRIEKIETRNLIDSEI